METLEIRDAASGSSAKILPELGFNCYAFRAVVRSPGGRVWNVDVVDAAPEFAQGQGRPSGHGIPILFPFPNRIRDGRYEWADRQWQIPLDAVCCDENGNAIHGFCLDRPWRVVDQSDDSVVGEFQLSVDAPHLRPSWPADFRIRVRYRVQGPVLRADVLIQNPDQVPLPWGFGTHPYFRLPLAEGSDPGKCLVEVPAREQWELVDCLPTGKRLPVGPACDLREGGYWGELKLDHVLTGLEPEDDGTIRCSVVDSEAGLQVTQRCGSEFREIVVYTPPGRTSVCLEPYTCVTDAVNLQSCVADTGWRVLEPGGEQRLWIEIRAGLVLA